VTRRQLLHLGLVTAALAAGAGLVAAGPVARRLLAAGHRSMHAPADLLARIRRRTRPLDPTTFHQPHDLAG
jgi:hypothetical protein